MKKQILNIAYISHFNFGVNKYGVSQYNEKYIKYMTKKGHAIDFYTLDPYNDINYKYNPLVQYYLIKPIPKNPFYYSYFFIKIPYMLRNKKYDIIHTTCGSGMFLKKIDFSTFHHYQKFQISKDFAYFHYFPIKIELKKARHIIAISEISMEQCINKEEINKNKITLIYQGIDCEKFKPRNKREIRAMLGVDPEDFIFLFVGFLEKRKNPQLLVKIAVELNRLKTKAKIIIIGDGPLKIPLYNLIRKRNLLDYFIFYKNVESIELFYNASDLVVVTSLLEGFGYLYLESVASGVPFISYPTGISPKISEHGFGILAENEKSYIKKAIDFIQDPFSFGETGNYFINKHFSIQKSIDATENLYYKYLERIKKI